MGGEAAKEKENGTRKEKEDFCDARPALFPDTSEKTNISFMEKVIFTSLNFEPNLLFLLGPQNRPSSLLRLTKPIK